LFSLVKLPPARQVEFQSVLQFPVLYYSPLPGYNEGMPYEELRHSADWEVHVWAADLTALFSEAALGMNALSGIRLDPGPRTTRTFEASGPDEESLLVAFLSELVYAVEQENLAFDVFSIHLEPDSIQAKLTGAPIRSIDKAIKAVTYHNLKICQTSRGMEVDIVFDV